MHASRTLKVLQFFVVLLSVGATSVYASMTTPGAVETAWVAILVAYVAGVLMPFVLRAFLNRLHRSVGSTERVSLGMAFASVIVPFIVVPYILVMTGNAIARRAEQTGERAHETTRRRIRGCAVTHAVSTVCMPGLAAGAAVALLPFEYAWAIGSIGAGLVTAMILAVTTQVLFQFAETVVVDTQGRASLSLGGTGGESSVGVRSV